MPKVQNSHGHECIKIKDVDSDMARWHGRQKSQAPTHALELKDLNKRSTIKVYVKQTVSLKRDLFSHLCIDIPLEDLIIKSMCNKQLFM